MSHLLQMRGLKHSFWAAIARFWRRIFYRCVDWNFRFAGWSCYLFVASFTDAWIETVLINNCSIDSSVASFTDAWIETRTNVGRTNTTTVASFTDAWIETSLFGSGTSSAWSHLLQMRGLKLKHGLVLLIWMRRIFYRCVDWNNKS